MLKRTFLLLILGIQIFSCPVYGKSYDIESEKINGQIECFSDDEIKNNEINEVVAKGKIKTNTKEIYDKLLDNQGIVKSYKDPDDKYIGTYKLDNGDSVDINDNYIAKYNKKGYFYIRNISIPLELTKQYVLTDKYNENIKDFIDFIRLKNLNIGKLNIFSVSAGEMRENENNINSDIPEEQRQYKDKWDDNDDIEVAFGYQRINNIPILPPIVLQSEKLLVESTDGAPIVAIFNKEGRAYISLGQIYEVKNTGKKIKIRPFKDIVSNIEEKYNNILTEKSFKPISAKLMYNIEKDQNNDERYNVKPIWKITVEDENGTKTASIYDATTGAEIIVGGMNLE